MLKDEKIRHIVESHVEKLFVEISEEFKLVTGDTTPDFELRLDATLESLVELSTTLIDTNKSAL